MSYFVIDVNGRATGWKPMHPAGDFTPYTYATYEEADREMRARYPDQVCLLPLGLARVRVREVVGEPPKKGG
jgi:hypothetical protein